MTTGNYSTRQIFSCRWDEADYLNIDVRLIPSNQVVVRSMHYESVAGTYHPSWGHTTRVGDIHAELVLSSSSSIPSSGLRVGDPRCSPLQLPPSVSVLACSRTLVHGFSRPLDNIVAPSRFLSSSLPFTLCHSLQDFS